MAVARPPRTHRSPRLAHCPTHPPRRPAFPAYRVCRPGMQTAMAEALTQVQSRERLMDTARRELSTHGLWNAVIWGLLALCGAVLLANCFWVASTLLTRITMLAAPGGS